MKNDIRKRALEGETFEDLNIVDFHCHMGPWYNFYFPKAEIEDMIYDADIVGIDKMCIAPHASLTCDYKLGNRKVKDAVDRFPKRAYAFLVINPNNPEEIKGEFDKYYKKKNFIGVKVHPFLRNYSLTGNNYIDIFDRVNKYGGCILSHSWEEDIKCNTDKCKEIIKSYPNVPFIIGHAAGTNKGVLNTIKLVNKYENAYMDTSGFEQSNIWIEEIVKKADYKKILFGSDMPFHDIRPVISRILFSNIDDSIKKHILSNNYYEMISKHPKKFS